MMNKKEKVINPRTKAEIKGGANLQGDSLDLPIDGEILSAGQRRHDNEVQRTPDILRYRVLRGSSDGS